MRTLLKRKEAQAQFFQRMHACPLEVDRYDRPEESLIEG
jgi:hypothetical protein